MNFVRKTAIFLIGSILPMLLLGFGVLFGLFQVLGSPTHIQDALDTSGAYDDAVSSIIKENATQSGTTSLEASNADDAIQKAVADSVPTEYVKDQTGGVLKGVYAWLDGNTSVLQFSVDLAPIKDNLIGNLTEQAKSRAQSLPTCAPGVQIAPDADAFSLNCLPAGVSTDQVVAQTREQMLGSELFKNANVTPQTVVGNGGQPIDSKLEPVKKGYQIAKQVMYATGIASALGIAAIIFLSRPWTAGIKRASYILITTGSVGIITALVGKLTIQALVKSFIEKSNVVEGAKAVAAAQALIADVCNWWLWLGIISVALAIAGLVGVKIWNKKHQTPENNDPGHKKESPAGKSNNTPAPELT
jgi:hypothetical protein